MWYLVLSWHRNLSWHLSLSEFSSSSCYFDLAYLSCHHAYVHLSFSCQLTLLVFMLIVDRAYSVFLTDPFCFASFLPFPPPLQVPGRKQCCLVRTSSAWRSSWMAWTFLGYGYFTVFTWGIIYENVFMLLYYCKTGFDVLWCKRL